MLLVTQYLCLSTLVEHADVILIDNITIILAVHNRRVPVYGHLLHMHPVIPRLRPVIDTPGDEPRPSVLQVLPGEIHLHHHTGLSIVHARAVDKPYTHVLNITKTWSRHPSDPRSEVM